MVMKVLIVQCIYGFDPIELENKFLRIASEGFMCGGFICARSAPAATLAFI